MKLNIEVKPRNNYPPTHTLLWRGWGGWYLTYLAPKDKHSWMLNCSVGTLNAKKILSLKINLFGLHKSEWCPWQPIVH